MVTTGSRSIDTMADRVCAVAADEGRRMDDEEWMRWLWRLGEKGEGTTPSLPVQALFLEYPHTSKLCHRLVFKLSTSSSPYLLVSAWSW
jgi:hypothetical protein